MPFKYISYLLHSSGAIFYVCYFSRGSVLLYCEEYFCEIILNLNQWSGADPGYLERGCTCIKVWGFAMLILSHFS